MTTATIKRLLFSKKTVGIVTLCFIPILIFGLWSAGAFPKDESTLYEENWNLIPELYMPPTDRSISVDIGRWNISGQNFEMVGSSQGSIDHLTVTILIYLSDNPEISEPYNFTTNSPNASSKGALQGPINYMGVIFEGTGSDENDWDTWRLSGEGLIPILGYTGGSTEFDQLSQLLEEYGIETPRVGIYVRAYSDNRTTEEMWNYDYMELYIHLTEDGVVIGEVGVDIETIVHEQDGYDVFMEVAPTLYFLFILPLITILYAISAVREDIENHTIVYLITRPISKTEILLYKFKGYAISAWLPIIISLTISFFIIAAKEGSVTTHLDYLGTLIGLMTLNIIAYGGIFFIFAIITSYPIVISLLYVFFWESIVSSLANVINRFTILFHIQAMADGILGDAANISVYDPSGVLDSFAVLIGVIVALFLIAALLFRYRDFT
jgi:ABC-2 type transport system permease protein